MHKTRSATVVVGAVVLACTGSDPDATLPLAELADDTGRVHSLVLREGRALTWAEYGDRNGVPLIELHGGGASHLSGLVYHREALEAGVRIIAADRPGAGGSTPDPDYTVAGFHEDLEQLADHLGLEQFVVMGNSNGGMFSIALAHAMPDRVWAERLPNAGFHLTSGGHAGQTSPATRSRIMRCVRTLAEGRPCESSQPIP